MYRLDQIQTDAFRQLEKEKTENKVHRNKDVVISDKDKEKEKGTTKQKNNKAQNKRYCTVEGIKYSNEKITVEAEKDDGINSAGIFIDSKK